MKKFVSNGLLALMCAGALFNASAQGNDWPAKQPLTLIVPFGPGSSPDTMARAVAEEAGKTLKQTIIVQNKPGASGNLGTDAIAKAKPDGYTFGVSITGPMVNNTLIFKTLPYNPVTDITPITMGVHQYNVLVVPADSPFKTLADLIAEMKRPDSKLNFPSTGSGTVSQLAVELLLDRVGGKALHVPYKSSPNAVTSLLGGDTAFAALPPVAVMPMIKAGRLRALAAVSAKRLDFLPDVATVAELGYPGVEGSGWIGFVAPAGIPANVKTQLNAALTQALSSPDVNQRLKAMYMEPSPSSADAFGQYMAEELKRWAPLIKRLNLAEN